MSQPFKVEQGDWPTMQIAVKPIRATVFIDEQCVPVDLEWDDEDAYATHYAAYDQQHNCIACGRLTKTGHVGRLAVLKSHRGQGAGKQILATIIATAKAQNLPTLVLNAQTHALSFYTQFGFTAFGEVFDDAGIPHRTMVKKFT